MASITSLSSARPRPARIIGLDIARAFAVLGMFLIHIASSGVTRGQIGWVDRVLDEANGRAMALFLVLSGCGMTLLFRHAAHPWRQAAGRAVVLLTIGLLLTGRTIVAVILPMYALYLFLGAATRRLSDRWLLVLAGAIGVVGAVARFHQDRFPLLVQSFDVGWAGGFPSLADPRGYLSSLFVTGSYPFFPEGALVLFGMWIARQVVDGRSIRRLALVGVALAAIGLGAGWLAADQRKEAVVRSTVVSLLAQGTDPMEDLRAQAAAEGVSVAQAIALLADETGLPAEQLEQVLSGTSEPSPVPRWAWMLTDTTGHSGLPGNTMSVAGLSALAIAASLSWSRRLRLLAPLGQMALTVYVAHLLLVWWLISWWPGRLGSVAVMGVTVALWAGLAVLAAWWSPRRGPLEALLRSAGNRAAGVRRRDPSNDGSAIPSVGRCADAASEETL